MLWTDAGLGRQIHAAKASAAVPLSGSMPLFISWGISQEERDFLTAGTWQVHRGLYDHVAHTRKTWTHVETSECWSACVCVHVQSMCVCIFRERETKAAKWGSGLPCSCTSGLYIRPLINPEWRPGSDRLTGQAPVQDRAWFITTELQLALIYFRLRRGESREGVFKGSGGRTQKQLCEDRGWEWLRKVSTQGDGLGVMGLRDASF